MGAEGVKWVSNATSPTLTRYHGAPTANVLYSPATQAAATSYFDALAPWGLMGRISMRPDGSVASRCKVNQTSLQVANNWGDNCYSDTNDDANGQQKIVYIKQFCYYIDTLTANQVWYWIGQIGDTFRLSNDSVDYIFTSADIHPAFIVDGVAKSGMFIGAYEASLNLSNVMQSVAGVTPTNQAIIQSVSTARGYANAIGSRWGFSTVQAWAATVLLFIIEYATFYSHGLCFGYGNGSANPLSTGTTTSYGNATGWTAANSSAVGMTYRGIENLWGNEGQFLEGYNIKADYAVWLAAQSAASGYYDCTAFDGAKYINTTLSLPPTVGDYTKSIATGTYGWGFIPATVGGGAYNTYACGTIVPATGNRVVFATGQFAQSWTAQNPLSQWCAGTTAATASQGYRIQYLP